ncbi:hypothetical protein NE237_031844 [Protea cynaroides]|uniref:Uncharacterized protein n=1 Tax=Protea cynaroides TaxID=273540 RepID=A0A9Q0L1Y6_9MAGN|nr:hypothetical protein NE237_031844 [Protea cynaroides]
MAFSDNTDASHETPAAQNNVSLDASIAQTESASTVTSSPPLVISNIASLIPIKLTSTNYLLWKSLFEPILRGHKLMHLIDGTMPTPIAATSPWYEKYQMLLSWINATLSESALPYISSAKKAWDILQQRYASATPAHIMSLKRQLSRIKKDGLPPTYRQFYSSIHIRARTTALSLEELHNLLICEELALTDDSLDQSQALATFRPPKLAQGQGLHSTRGRGHSSGHGYYPPRRYNNERGLLPLPTSTDKTGTRSKCQICQKIGHSAIDCYHRMYYTYHGRHPPEKLAAMVSSAQPDTHTWFSDTGASHHLTPDVDNLQQFPPSDGIDAVQIGNGQGPAENGLYPFRVPAIHSTSPQAHFSSSVPPIQWHARLITAQKPSNALPSKYCLFGIIQSKPFAHLVSSARAIGFRFPTLRHLLIDPLS